MTTSAANPEGAKLGALMRTIPDAVLSISVNTTATQPLSSVNPTDGAGGNGQDLRGRWVWLAATGADVTILRKATFPTTAGVGLVLAAGAPPIEFFVDTDDTAGAIATLAARSASAATLLVMWDSRIKG